MDIYDKHQDGDDQGDGRQSYSSTPTPQCPPLLPPLLSINRLLALHSRERLLVHPLRWTDRQPALLGCRIHSHHDEVTNATAKENTRVASSKSNPFTDRLAKRLKCEMGPGNLVGTTAQLLAPLDARLCVKLNRTVNFYFDRRPSTCIRVCCVSIPMPQPDILTLTCLDFNETMLEREFYFSPSENPRHMDWAGLRRADTLIKLHTPKDPQKDPFVVALVIAVAQGERRHAPQPLPPDSSFTLGLLLDFFEL
ncbi:uncharacterized protein B0H64DRAFT_202874 [Chaetomium fimeti]|uniref:Uncharacterized protein n=1 Tax=Chaetomium fimeti TaxID=1854472 RepID=A0AAE0LPC2_9PEZI|nr:hypothetical protein B0H64DRAFT_202874 [Chaetomium fimeti]